MQSKPSKVLLAETCLPPRVEATLGFLMRHKVWHLKSRNSVATSCRDAAARRVRLGNIGIPLYDELKSLCVVVYRSDQRHFALLHARASSRFDLESARIMLGAERPLATMANDELRQRTGADYGTVNPFSEPRNFIHVFDRGVLAKLTPPYTMMTNAGDYTWAVEFHPDEIIEALHTECEVHVGSITDSQATADSLPAFGIITGNGPESGMTLWQRVNEEVHRRLSAHNRMYGDLSYPRVVVHSIPEMGLSMELEQREEQVWSVIRSAIDDLHLSKVTHIAIACNTTQYFADRIREYVRDRGLAFVSMAEVVTEYVRDHSISDLTVIGIPVVAELGSYSAYRPIKDVGVRTVSPETLLQLQELGYMVKKLPYTIRDSRALNKLRLILERGTTTKNVLIALTEISVLLDRFPKFKGEIAGRAIIDPLHLYANALARIYIDALPDLTQERLDSLDAEIEY